MKHLAPAGGGVQEVRGTEPHLSWLAGAPGLAEVLRMFLLGPFVSPLLIKSRA